MMCLCAVSKIYIVTLMVFSISLRFFRAKYSPSERMSTCKAAWHELWTGCAHMQDVGTKATKFSVITWNIIFYIAVLFVSLLFIFIFIFWVLIETESLPDILMLPVPGAVASSICLQKNNVNWWESGGDLLMRIVTLLRVTLNIPLQKWHVCFVSSSDHSWAS